MLRALKIWLTVAIVVSALAYGGYYYYQNNESSPVTYKTLPMTQGDVTKKVSSTGSLRAVTNTSVGCEVSGTIVKLYVDYNSKVKKGDMLALIDPSTILTQVEQQEDSLADLQAAYQNAVANLANVRSGVPKADAGIFSAQPTVEAA